MPKQGQRAEVNTFIQGLITEASPLNFPPNASKQEENFELFRDGTRRRRMGFDYEYQYSLIPITDLGPVNIHLPFGYNSFLWRGVAGDPLKNFLVVQFRYSLYFFDTSLSNYTTAGYLGNISISEQAGEVNKTFASVEGRLVVAAKDKAIAIVVFNPDTSTFSYTIDTIKVRDFWGIETANASVESDYYFQPTTLDLAHIYNLQNQSWGLPRKDSTGTLSDPIQLFLTEYSKYPSNSEIVWTGLQYQAVVSGSDPYERVFPKLYKDVFGLSPIASKGYYIIDLMDRGLSRVAQFANNYSKYGSALVTSAITAVDDISEGGATCICEYAGRIWYSGFQGRVISGDKRSPNLSNYVVFSQVVRNSKDITKCYQEGDPTSRDGADVVDTDGGYLRISGAQNILGMRYIKNDLIIIAENGVWAITGGAEYGFTATNFKVTKLSAFGCSSKTSIVEQGQAILYWGDGGIYSVDFDKTGMLAVTNLTQTTIQSLYDDIPQASRDTAIGVYDETTKKARWIYRYGALLDSTAVTKELVLDFSLGNFSLNTIKQSPGYVSEVISPVFTDQGVAYIVLTKQSSDPSHFSFTIGRYWNEEFLDWKSVDNIGVDAKAFLLTGAQIAGDSAVHKQTPYIVMHFERTETTTDASAIPLNQSSCLFKTYWDWAGNEISNKVSQMQQGYRYRKPLFATPLSDYDNGFEVVSTKSKLRGRGRSFALYLETEPKKDCHILGWNLTINGDALA